METTNLGKSIKEIFDGQYKYIVPLYQRNFAWRQEQIEQLLQDVYEAYKAYKENNAGNYFIGSLVVLKRSNGDFEVIDGQQRLTTLSLITKILRINDEPRLFYDSRPEVEEFFKAFYKSENAECSIDYPQTYHLKNAINYIKDAKLDAKENDKTLRSIEDGFKSYFANNVILVRVEIPQDTDVASYFEIMNNRGEQLQKHEILKSLMMKDLDAAQRNEFALIWDACSQMDIPIQKSFKAGSDDTVGTRNYYFGKNYDEYKFKGLAEVGASNEDNPQNKRNNGENEDSEKGKGITIDDIIDGKKDVKSIVNDFNDDEKYESESQYKSIIDFPNFLMHVFKVMSQDEEVVPLNEKFLLSKYKELEKSIKPELFIEKLLFCRTVFDRYVVKTTVNEKDTEDGEKWELIKPKNYGNKWEYIGTYNNSNGTSKEQTRIVKALSMLQVTFRTRIYKNWLYEVLKWFDDKRQQERCTDDGNTAMEHIPQIQEDEKERNTIDASYEDYIRKLDEIILGNYKNLDYKNLPTNDSLTKNNSYSLGTNTPHFLFNFIDYLYWVDSQNEKSIFGEKNPKNLKEFEFKYWNSVEHHMAREWADRNQIKDKDEFIDNLGNLCLISKSANSRLSDRDVKEKVETFGKGNLGANRQIIYNETKNHDGTYTWDKDKIKKHYNALLDLLSKRKDILGLTSK